MKSIKKLHWQGTLLKSAFLEVLENLETNSFAEDIRYFLSYAIASYTSKNLQN